MMPRRSRIGSSCCPSAHAMALCQRTSAGEFQETHRAVSDADAELAGTELNPDRYDATPPRVNGSSSSNRPLRLCKESGTIAALVPGMWIGIDSTGCPPRSPLVGVETI